MTLTLELTPAEEARLSAAARARGQAPEEFLRTLISTLPESQDPTLALLSQWIAEGENATPAEREQAAAETAEFKANMNRWRQEAGERPLYR
jgi:hypothetical protein